MEMNYYGREPEEDAPNYREFLHVVFVLPAWSIRSVITKLLPISLLCTDFEKRVRCRRELYKAIYMGAEENMVWYAVVVH